MISFCVRATDKELRRWDIETLSPFESHHASVFIRKSKDHQSAKTTVNPAEMINWSLTKRAAIRQRTPN
jgi:hypothetical protein